jgi:hypothetical protein
MESVLSAVAEILFAKTARLFLRLFGVRNIPEWVAILLGLFLWLIIGIIVVVLVRRT